jgi:hypothetical protein
MLKKYLPFGSFFEWIKFNLYEVLKNLTIDDKPVLLSKCAYDDLCIFANFLF